MEPHGTPWPLGQVADPAALCRLLARLDTEGLPEAAPLFGRLGPSIWPLFRGPMAELLLVRWRPGQSTLPETLGDSTLAVRPIEGRIELQTFVSQGGRTAQLIEIESLGLGEIAGIPAGAIFALRAREPAVTLHLCAPPVVVRQRFDAGWA